KGDNTLTISIQDDGTNSYGNSTPGADIGKVTLHVITAPKSSDLGNTEKGSICKVNPISLPSGVKIESAVDLTTANRIINFGRTYLSSYNKWFYSYSRHIKTHEIKDPQGNTIETVYIRQSDIGELDSFVHTNTNGDGQTFEYRSQNNSTTLKKVGGSQYVYTHGTTEEIYSVATGDLLSITNPAASADVTYTGTGKVISDTDGNAIAISGIENGAFTVTNGGLTNT
ncbi:MAG: hypothetical protein GY706_07235, partial [Bacteroides sp.]|nr:hypothetical protein [Bacteroides sp.]